jgi:hypothetical protein
MQALAEKAEGLRRAVIALAGKEFDLGSLKEKRDGQCSSGDQSSR